MKEEKKEEEEREKIEEKKMSEDLKVHKHAIFLFFLQKPKPYGPKGL